AEAAALLEPFAASESDVAFLDTFAEALRQAGQLDRARSILERLLREKNEGIMRLFDLADAYSDLGQDTKSVEILQTRFAVRPQQRIYRRRALRDSTRAISISAGPMTSSKPAAYALPPSSPA